MTKEIETGKPFTYHPVGKEYAFLVDLQGLYRKKRNQTMGLARLVDIIVRKERQSQKGRLKLLT